mmetsp:Transcript_26730/g.44837  ORF Transcript_26730/g.44837 Transcript_26730/m.44837 type:complete len:247 (-) Transcript_26730:644-1384(-)
MSHLSLVFAHSLYALHDTGQGFLLGRITPRGLGLDGHVGHLHELLRRRVHLHARSHLVHHCLLLLHVLVNTAPLLGLRVLPLQLPVHPLGFDVRLELVKFRRRQIRGPRASVVQLAQLPVHLALTQRRFLIRFAVELREHPAELPHLVQLVHLFHLSVTCLCHMSASCRCHVSATHLCHISASCCSLLLGVPSERRGGDLQEVLLCSGHGGFEPLRLVSVHLILHLDGVHVLHVCPHQQRAHLVAR